MKSIRLKLIIMYLTLVFLVIIVCGTFMLIRIRYQEFNDLQRSLTDFAAYFESYIRANIPLESVNDEDFQAGLQEEMKNFYLSNDPARGIEGSILDIYGNTIYNTASLDLTFRSSAIISAIAGQAAFNSNRWGTDTNNLQSEMLEYAYPLTDPNNGEIMCIIFMRAKTDAIYTRLNEMINVFMLALLIALVMAAVLGSLFSGTITAPIRTLTKNAKELAEGNLSNPLQTDVKSNDEIGLLTESFNHMAKELSQNLETITTENNKLEILLHTMTDGVLAYDNAGRLIHANQSSQELLNAANLNEVDLNAMAARLGITNGLEFGGRGNIQEAAAYIGDRYIGSVFSPYYNKHGQVDGVVVVLQDITKHKKLDDMRQEFVANVSHEIRTPLTTIKGYAETLLNGAIDDKADAANFLSVIDKAADQMTVLVNDLLELTKYDNRQFALKLSMIELNGVIGQAVKQMKPLAEKKNQEIVFVPEPGAAFIEADEDRVIRVFLNVIGNSIKYSPDSATIAINLEKSDKYYRVYIRDNGIGIPREDLRRIFERFYRVDKARSRAMGGTGLGLAIAKEIMEAHGGRISATSEVGKGTCMIFRFNRHKPDGTPA